MAASDYSSSVFLNGKKTHNQVRVPWGDAVLGNGPVYFSLYKQTNINLYKDKEEINILDHIKNKLDGYIHEYKDRDGSIKQVLNDDVYRDSFTPLEIEYEGRKITVWFTSEDNFYVYARLIEPNGDVWTAFSGYGVGDAFLLNQYEYDTAKRIDNLFRLFPIKGHEVKYSDTLYSNSNVPDIIAGLTIRIATNTIESADKHSVKELSDTFNRLNSKILSMPSSK